VPLYAWTERGRAPKLGRPPGWAASMKSRRSHSTYPEYLDPRRVPLPLREQERAQVRSPSLGTWGARCREGGECHAAREVHYRRPIGWVWTCANMGCTVAPLSLKDRRRVPCVTQREASTCERRPSNRERGSETLSIGPSDRRAPVRSLFLSEVGTMSRVSDVNACGLRGGAVRVARVNACRDSARRGAMSLRASGSGL